MLQHHSPDTSWNEKQSNRTFPQGGVSQKDPSKKIRIFFGCKDCVTEYSPESILKKKKGNSKNNNMSKHSNKTAAKYKTTHSRLKVNSY